MLNPQEIARLEEAAGQFEPALFLADQHNKLRELTVERLAQRDSETAQRILEGLANGHLEKIIFVVEGRTYKVENLSQLNSNKSWLKAELSKALATWFNAFTTSIFI